MFPTLNSQNVVGPLKSNILEFDRLLEKHATQTGLPVVVDFYSDSCGPCRMMAPIFKKVAAEFVDKAVFVKIDTNAQHELSARYQIRSLPTFQFFIDGKKAHQAVGGIGEQGLRQETASIVRQAEAENAILTLEALVQYYQQVDSAKPKADVEQVHQKCVEMNKKIGHCVGASANQLARKLKKKYGSAPKLVPRFHETDRQAKDKTEPPKTEKTGKANLQTATKEELLKELQRREDLERDAQVEAEEPMEDEEGSEVHRWVSSGFPERVVIVGGGPAGMAAAIYGARAGLTPLVIAPSMGGQLQGKGVDVENYPGLSNVTGPAVVSAMRQQAAHFGAVFEDDFVTGIDISSRPFKVHTNATGKIATHTIIVATGAESNWLDIPGEWEMRGGGVSSCATCDGFLYSGRDVVVVGGGDAAMEEALVLARTSKSVTVIHRRDRFRASKVLAERVLNHPSISVRWNSTVQQILGKQLQPSTDDENVDIDNTQKVVTGIELKDVTTGELSKISCDAVFIAIGHTPNTVFLQGVVEFDPNHPGYLVTFKGSTQTSVPGIFAAGDVADAVYRQAITSAGSGAAAALDAERYLNENGLGNEEAELEASLLEELIHEDHPRESYNVYDDSEASVKGMKESISSEL